MPGFEIKTLENLLLHGISKELFLRLKNKEKLSLEESVTLIITYIDILEYNKANELLHQIKLSLDNQKQLDNKLNKLLFTFLENKLILIKSAFAEILKNTKAYNLLDYANLASPKEKTVFLLLMFIISEALFRSGSYIDSQKLGKSILDLRENPDDSNNSNLALDVVYGLYYRIQFMNYLYLGELDQCQDVAFKGLDIYQKNSNIIYQAYFYNFLGIVSSLKGDLFKGEQSFRKSIQFFESMSESESSDKYSVNYTAGIYSNISGLLREQGRLKEAIDITRGSLKIYEKLQQQIEIANCYNYLGIFYRDLRDYELSEAYLYKAYYIRKKFNDPFEISESLVNICILEELTGRLNENSICVSEFPENYESKLVQINELLIKGLIFYTKKDYNNALEKLNTVLETEGVDFSIRLLIMDYKAQIFLELDDYRNFVDLLSFWIVLAKENNLYSSLFKAYLIKFRFELLFMNLESAKNLIEDASEIAKNYSTGAQRLVEENQALLKRIESNFAGISKKPDESLKKKTKEEQLKELKLYIKEINSLLTSFEDQKI